jgi:PAS domain S-box-containing protein
LLAWSSTTRPAELHQDFSEQELRQLLAVGTDLVAVIGFDGYFKVLSQNWATALGWSADELRKTRLIDLVHPDDLEETLALRELLRNADSKVLFDNRYRTKSGDYVWLSWLVIADTAKELFYCSVADITKKRRTEEALRDSERRFRFIVESNPGYVWTTDPEGRLLYINHRYLDWVGLTLEQAQQFGYQDLIYPDDLQGLAQEFESAGEERRPMECAHRMKGADGQYRWILARGLPEYDKDDKLTGWFGVTFDIDELKIAQDKLRISEERNRLLARAGILLSSSLVPEAVFQNLVNVVTEDISQFAFIDVVLPDGRVQRSHWSYSNPEAASLYNQISNFSPPRSNIDHPISAVIRTGKARLMAQVTEEWLTGAAISNEHLEFLKKLRLKCFVCAPIVVEQEIIGALTLCSLEPDGRQYTEADLELAEDLGRRAGTAIHNARLFSGAKINESRYKSLSEDLARAEQRNRFLVILGDSLRSHRDTNRMVHEACKLTGDHLKVSRCFYAFYFPETDTAVVDQDYSNGVPPFAGEYTISDFGREFDARMRGGETLVVSDVQSNSITRDTSQMFSALNIAAFVTVSIIKDGQFAALFVVHQNQIRDWTTEEVELLEDAANRIWDAVQRAKSESELRELNEQLEVRVEERTEKLQAAVRDLEGFTYSVSHDMRAPLRSIIANSRMVLADVGDSIDADAASCLHELSTSATKLAQLVDDLLQFARLGQAALRKRTINLSQVIEDTVRSIEEDQNTVIRHAIQPNLDVNADLEMVKLVVRNLLENSVKYRKPVEPTQIEFFAEQTDSGSVFCLKDYGIGWDPHYTNKIFIPFERLHRDSDIPGNGIGLANVKRIVERHGGVIWAESNPGEGSTFYFTLG